MTTHPTWHGHKMHPDAHPLRPWWRWHHGKGWLRSDGRTGLNGRLLFRVFDGTSERHVDEIYPLCAPVRATGQQWIVVEADAPVWTDALSPASWPPPGAVLVEGPGAPWAPAAMGRELLTSIEAQRVALTQAEASQRIRRQNAG